jgi:AraC-like DNA-binding protein
MPRAARTAASTPPAPPLHTAATARSDDKLQLMLRLGELAGLVERFAQRDGEHATAVPGLTLLRLSAPCRPMHALHRPALCLIAQGAKQLLLADELYAYDATTYLVVAQDLPVMAQVVQASEQSPYLCVRLDLDPADLAQCVADWSPAAVASERSSRGLFVGGTQTALLDPLLRLVRLLEAPHDIAALAPLAVREIIYRLLAGPEGWRLAQLGLRGSQARRIAQAIAWLREHPAEPLRVEALARSVHMSASSLHHHFKAVTAMSPLQYQKRLRLYEARRLLLAGAVDAATAAFQVGYQSPSQFSREYSRLFGAPPARDLRGLRERSTGG